MAQWGVADSSSCPGLQRGDWGLLGGEGAGPARRLQVFSGWRAGEGKVGEAHAPSTPLEAGLSPWQLKQLFRLTSEDSGFLPLATTPAQRREQSVLAVGAGGRKVSHTLASS